MMSGRRKKPERATVNVTSDDVSAMKHSKLNLEPEGVKRAAKARAAARELFLECKSAEATLNALLSALPKPMVDSFCRAHLKQ